MVKINDAGYLCLQKPKSRKGKLYDYRIIKQDIDTVKGVFCIGNQKVYCNPNLIGKRIKLKLEVIHNGN
jgi:hypothetical protein